MALPDWLVAVDPWRILVKGVVVYAVVIVLTRLNGLRSFSEMSAFDFAMTIAIGSVVATIVLMPRPSLVEGAAALALLFLLQGLVSWGRRKSSSIQRGVDNEPLLLMRKGEMLERNLARGRITKDDLRAKLRANGVLRYDEVEAVVLETTGDISVVKRQDGVHLDADLLQNVRR